MWKSVVIEWIDFAWKTYIANILRVFWYKKYVMKEICWSLDDISPSEAFNNLYKIISQEHSLLVFDRFFISLFVYYINTWITFDSEYLKSTIVNFLTKMSWSKIIFMTNNYQITKKRILFRKNILRKSLSNHDVNIINDENYFNKYYKIFSDLIDLIDEIIKTEKIDIKIYKIDTSYMLLGLF